MPPRQRREDIVIIGLLGGSVAQSVAPFLQDALNRWFAANNPPRRPIVLNLAVSGAKQPQQTLTIANTLLLGGEFDLIVNLDGFNEIIFSAGWNPQHGLFPFFPTWWDKPVGLTRAEFLLAGRIAVLRREQARRAAAWENSPRRGSALFGLINRWRQERNAAVIIRLNHELAAVAAAYKLEKYGPRSWLTAERKRLPAAAGVWYRSSVMLARLAELAGADYYHYLQPNQYVPDSKPLSPEERELYYEPYEVTRYFTARGYPLLRALGQGLPGQGVNYFDLTRIFADHPETLYRDECCHLNDRGNELLAAAIAQRLEPALFRRGGASPARPVSPLAAGRPPPPPPRAFQVFLQEDGKELRYVRENCVPEDTEPWFFLHLVPQDGADLPSGSR